MLHLAVGTATFECIRLAPARGTVAGEPICGNC
jgi:hypothetical protein